MTSPYLIPDLKIEEGLRLNAYPDPLSGGAPWTIGYGHTGQDVVKGLVWTETQAEDNLANDVASAVRDLDLHLPWWRELDDLRQDVLADMTFNMGVRKVMLFHRTLAAIEGKLFTDAANGMLASAWAHQVGRRAQRLAQQMRTGEHVVP